MVYSGYIVYSINNLATQFGVMVECAIDNSNPHAHSNAAFRQILFNVETVLVGLEWATGQFSYLYTGDVFLQGLLKGGYGELW